MASFDKKREGLDVLFIIGVPLLHLIAPEVTLLSRVEQSSAVAN
jgi:hypothetical protein